MLGSYSQTHVGYLIQVNLSTLTASKTSRPLSVSSIFSLILVKIRFGVVTLVST
jgi:hypothetical protein